MKITEVCFNQMLNCRLVPPETGGILGMAEDITIFNENVNSFLELLQKGV